MSCTYASLSHLITIMKARLLSLCLPSFSCFSCLFLQDISLATSAEPVAPAPTQDLVNQVSYSELPAQLWSLLKASETEFNEAAIAETRAAFQANDRVAIAAFSQRMRAAAASSNPLNFIAANELAAAYIQGYTAELELLWWKTNNRELRLRILMIFYGSRKDVDVSFFPRFEDYCAKFNPQESSARYQELLCIIRYKAQIEEELIKKLNPASKTAN